MHTPVQLGFIQNFGIWELLIILAIGLLLFGRRLPEVGKSLGKGIVEFRKGLREVEEEVDTKSRARPQERLPEERPYRAPLSSSGEDVRVSRADVIEEEPAARPAEKA